MCDTWKGDCEEKLRKLIAPDAKIRYDVAGAVKALHEQGYPVEEIGHALYSIGKWRARQIVVLLTNITNQQHAQEIVATLLEEAISKDV